MTVNSMEIRARLEAVRERIAQAKLRAGRDDDVTIVAVTKTMPTDVVAATIAAGLQDIGENRVQELDAKVEELGRDAARWHLIGHLQRNKVRRAIECFDLLHSLDSPRLAAALSEAAVRAGTTVRALVQVNTSGEASKYGLDPDSAVDAIGGMAELPGLELEGVMTMAPWTADARTLHATFAGARVLAEQAARQVSGFRVRHLSMGMSNDFEIAVAEGSTLVRLGTVLLGERDA
jgi:PLP dependent protein